MLTLNDVNLNELKGIGRALEIKGYSTMRKTPLIDAINAAMNETEEAANTVNAWLEDVEARMPEKAEKVATPSLGITELTYNGKTQSIKAWAEEVGLNRPALYDRINRHGWSIEEALTIPAGERRKKRAAEVEPEVDGQVSMDEIEENAE